MFEKLLFCNGRRHPRFWGERAMAAVRLACAFLVVSASLVLSMQTVAATGKPAVGQKSTTRLPHCSWDEPGRNPFMGDVVAAVDRYSDIPIDVRARLKLRMAQRDYDDVVGIRRDSLIGKHSYDPVIRDMHFGVDRVCSQVSRLKWAADQQERGLVYCEGSQCILVPTVCRNVSRITRLEPVAAMSAQPSGGELLFDAPGAGEITGAVPEAPGPDTFAAQSMPVNSPGIGSEVVPQLKASDSPATGPGRDNDPQPGSSPPPPPGGVNFGGPGSPGSPGIPGITGSPGSPGTTTVPIAAIPEPGTWALMLLGLAACFAQAVHRRSRKPDRTRL